VKVSESEKKLLDKVREDEFGTNSVPYGEVIQQIIEENYGF